MQRPPPTLPRRARLSRWALIGWAALLVLPSLALWQLAKRVEWYYVVEYTVAISLLTMGFYAHDKGRAQSGGWRTPESTLHLLELLGGWPGAFLAQRLLWHKVSKRSFQRVFWLIVVAYQFTSFEFLTDRSLSRLVLHTAGLRVPANWDPPPTRQELVPLNAGQTPANRFPWQSPLATPASEKQKSAKELRHDLPPGKGAKDSPSSRSQ